MIDSKGGKNAAQSSGDQTINLLPHGCSVDAVHLCVVEAAGMKRSYRPHRHAATQRKRIVIERPVQHPRWATSNGWIFMSRRRPHIDMVIVGYGWEQDGQYVPWPEDDPRHWSHKADKGIIIGG